MFGDILINSLSLVSTIISKLRKNTVAKVYIYKRISYPLLIFFSFSCFIPHIYVILFAFKMT